MIALLAAATPLCSPLPTPAQVDGIPVELAAEYFGEAEQLCEEDAGALWGRALDGPMLFLDGRSGTMVANQPDDAGLLSEAGFVWHGPLAEGVGIANTAQRWAGTTWTSIVWPLPGDPIARRRLMAHELFHALQPRLGSCRFEQAACTHLDTREGRVLLRLELRALAAALGAPPAERGAHLADAQAARALRWQRFEAAQGAEVALESNEGVAEYTGVRLAGEDAAAQRRHAAARLRGEEGSANLTRSFAYATGPALGLLLDDALAAREAPSWRAAFTGTVDFAAALAAACDLASPADLEAAVEAALVRHGGAALLAEEAEREAVRLAQEQADRRRLLTGPVLRLPTGTALRYEFDPYRVRTLPGVGQVHEALTARDAWGKLEVQRGGALLLRDEAGTVVGVQVPAPTERSSAGAPGRWGGDGWTLELAAGWRAEPAEREGDLRLVR